MTRQRDIVVAFLIHSRALTRTHTRTAAIQHTHRSIADKPSPTDDCTFLDCGAETLDAPIAEPFRSSASSARAVRHHGRTEHKRATSAGLHRRHLPRRTMVL